MSDGLLLLVQIMVILDAMDLMMRIDAADNEDDDDDGGSGNTLEQCLTHFTD